MVGCIRCRGARARERFDQRHLASQCDGTWLTHGAHDEDPLAAVLDDGGGDLRIAEEAGRQKLLQLGLELRQRQARCYHPSDQRKRE